MMEANCRLCLGTDDLQAVFPERNGFPTSEQIQHATSLKILETDMFSKCVCSSCLRTVQATIQLRAKALETDLWWRRASRCSQEDFNYFHAESTSSFSPPIMHPNPASNVKTISISSIANLKELAKVGTKKSEPEPLKPLLPASVFKKITITPLFSCKQRPTSLVERSQQASRKFPSRKVQIQTIVKIQPPPKRLATRYHLVCEICGKISKNRDRFNEHRNCHFNTKPFRCSQCPLRFNARNSQKRHMRVHQNIKPFVCKLCAKTYSALHHLKAHMSEKHTTEDERKYHCNVCKKSFLFNFLLTAHLKNHLNARKTVKVKAVNE